MFERIYEALQPSCSIAIFSQNVQALVELQNFMIQWKLCLKVRIEELWCREYQVLTMRTHPQMSMHGASGYVLSAVKVA